MITATLCTTNGKEPWGAHVPFELKNNSLITTLNTKFTHFQNLKVNPNAVVVYKQNDLELIMKATAEIKVNDSVDASISFGIHWLRVVRNGAISDTEDVAVIAKELQLTVA